MKSLLALAFVGLTIFAAVSVFTLANEGSDFFDYCLQDSEIFVSEYGGPSTKLDKQQVERLRSEFTTINPGNQSRGFSCESAEASTSNDQEIGLFLIENSKGKAILVDEYGNLIGHECKASKKAIEMIIELVRNNSSK